MTNRFARRVADLKASEIREILKLTQNPEVISFAGGLPAPETFPVAAVADAAARVLASHGAVALQYATTEGHRPLREWLARFMTQRRGAWVSPDEILITNGSQQGLDLVGKALLDEGDAVLCESPTYVGALNALQVFQPRFVPVPTDDDGMLPEGLDRLLGETERAKMVYAIPDFQNPSGRCWSRERRERVVAVAARHGVPVVEDAPYSELRFAGEPLPSLKSFDQRGTVIHLGTFSKILSPGLRLAWIVAPGWFAKPLNILKSSADLHTSTFTQMVAAEHLAGADLDTHLARIRELYRQRRDVMVQALEREMPAEVRFTRPEGGLFLWVELPARLDARELLPCALARNVAFVPGGSFWARGGGDHTLRLNYSNMPPERIEEGVRRLGEVVREALANADSPGAASARAARRVAAAAARSGRAVPPV
jgi:2-aminoadipate transaminase